MNEEEIKKAVKDSYADVATKSTSCGTEVGSCCGSTVSTEDSCGTEVGSCCGSAVSPADLSKKIGYADDEIQSVPEGSNLGLGCGNPIALASLREGETVLDLGSGAGFDCFLAANKVGKAGKVIGVDMTPEMITKATENVKKSDYGNVEFRLGDIEKLPVGDNSVDVVISNCVINLSPDKKRVFKEAFRALKPGGRLMVSDTVLLKELPDHIKNSVAAYVGCISGAIRKEEYLKSITEAGFHDVRIVQEAPYPGQTIIASINVQGVK